MPIIWRELLYYKRYGLTTINRILSEFFILFPYIILSNEYGSTERTIKAMISWYWLVQLMFRIGGGFQEERQLGTFTITLMAPQSLTMYLHYKYIAIIIDCYVMTTVTLFLLNLFGYCITNIVSFYLILALQSYMIFIFSCLYCAFSLKYKKLDSFNSFIQHAIGILSGYTQNIARFPIYIRCISYLIPLTYSILFSTNELNFVLIVSEVFLTAIYFLFGKRLINKSVSLLKMKGETEQW